MNCLNLKYRQIVKIDLYIQIGLMSLILLSAITIYGIIVALMILPIWGAWQLASSSLHAFLNWSDKSVKLNFIKYWIGVCVIATLLIATTISEDIHHSWLFLGAISLIISFCLGVFHVIIIQKIYDKLHD